MKIQVKQLTHELTHTIMVFQLQSDDGRGFVGLLAGKLDKRIHKRAIGEITGQGESGPRWWFWKVPNFWRWRWGVNQRCDDVIPYDIIFESSKKSVFFYVKKTQNQLQSIHFDFPSREANLNKEEVFRTSGFFGGGFWRKTLIDWW